MAGIKFVFICQVVDRNDPAQATTVKWIESFAKHSSVEQIHVLALRTGEFSLPRNVTVSRIKESSRSGTLRCFYTKILQAIRQGAQFFFIYQGGAYPALLLPFKIFLRKPIYQWKAHTFISWQMACYARFCDTKIFTSTVNAFPMNLSKIRVVGQGVDIEKFTIKTTKRKKDLVTVSRVSSVKRLDHMLYLLDACKRQFGATYHLDIYGPVLLEGDVQYQRKLESLIQKLNLSGQVSFKGAVSQDELPEILNEYRGFLNYCTGAVNRSVVEAMACGLPVLSTNPGVADILSPELRPSLVMSEHDIEQQATLLHNLLSQDDNRLPEIGAALRRIIVQEHSVEGLVDKIVREISS